MTSFRTMRHLTLVVVVGLAVVARPGVAGAVVPSGPLTLHVFTPLGSFSEAQNAQCESHLNGAPYNDLCDGYRVTTTNSGSAPLAGPTVVKDMLPAGVSVPRATLLLDQAVQIPNTGEAEDAVEGECPTEGSPATGVTVTCTYEGTLAPDEALLVLVSATVGPLAHAGEENTASVTGAGLPVVSVTEQMRVGVEPPAFGPTANGLVSYVSGSGGEPFTQAGGHPYEMTTRFDLKSTPRVSAEGNLKIDSVQDLRDVVFDLPLGMVGDAQATPACPLHELATNKGCPENARIGQIVSEPTGALSVVHNPLYNLVPEKGVAAELGFNDGLKTTHVIYASVAPTPAGYVLRATTREVPQIELTNAIVTLYGDPAARIGQGATPVAFFTNPSDCASGSTLQATAFLDSWQAPGPFVNAESPAGEPSLTGENWKRIESSPEESPPVTGCNALHFNPAGFSFKPDTTTADSPTGATFDLKVPQDESPNTLATPPLKDATVTLPPGLTVDPSAAGGLQACTGNPADTPGSAGNEIGWLGPVSETNHGYSNFTPAAPSCPEASKVGSVEVASPLIATKLEGSVYLAQQFENPYHSLLAGYVVIDDPTTGTVVKVPGEIKTNESTGQITGIFNDNPQIPFSELKIHFFGGPRGDLATPEACGTYTTNADLEPWSAPESGPDATPSDSFNITNGCVSGFTPAFSAGTTSPQAGAFSPFVLSFGREDDEQGLGGLTVNLPTGLVGKITGVGQCSEAQVAAAVARSSPGQGAAELANPSCPASSEVGTVTTATGPGPLPYSVTGKAYLTGPYKGAPYGLAVIVPAVAGPFDLGVVVIRQALYINPTDAHVTDVSDPLPTIRDGIPLRIKRVNVTLNRPNFTLNPTSCETKAITGTATSTTGAQAALSARYQAAGCAGLPFHPEFTASTEGHTSKQNGASLHVKIGFPAGQANIHKVELTIPNILPSRLTTLQKACTEAQFNTNPAGCPSASLIATAIAHTPLLPDPLSGPVYFVSHGGAAFPDTVMVLQGDNVKLEVVGHTDIKHGVTYSRFETVPDAPVTSFEFNAPEGPYSIFGSNGNLCQTEVRMPTTITAQSGAVLTQSTLVQPEGCPNTISVLSHKVKKGTLTLKVAVPGAGKLTAAGKRLTTASTKAHGRGTVTLTLKAKGHGKLSTKVKLTFTPAKGKKLTAALTARFKKS